MDLKWGSAPNPARGILSLWTPDLIKMKLIFAHNGILKDW